MNGDAFVGLNKLEIVYFDENECIDESFEFQNTANIPNTVSSNCGYCESDLIECKVLNGIKENAMTCKANLKSEKAKGNMLRDDLDRTTDELYVQSIEISTKNERLQLQEVSLKKAVRAYEQCEANLAKIMDVADKDARIAKLEAKLQALADSRTQTDVVINLVKQIKELREIILTIYASSQASNHEILEKIISNTD
jgi:hypothetical protein